MTTPSTFTELSTLTGWVPIRINAAGDQKYPDDPPSDGDTIVGACFKFGDHEISAVYDPDGDREAWCSISRAVGCVFRDECDEESAVGWLLGMRRLIEYVSAHPIPAPETP